ncbi:hypothetical protein DEH18_33490 [Streptomyces sp. NHF165]|uniref:hypothetical protein n=1 Tax=Streptomyces sp. NHF165 TaxID=2175864 RepID=UPI00132E7594|nr:hypothetical protein [Streptomyces sp. NHF165]QHF97942.1 hypothetical protein DEH18_33490 [Streptomyces sp. NHF165]
MSTAPPPSDPSAVAVELERIRRTIEVGFTRTDGALALLVQRTDQTEQRLTEHEQHLDRQDARLDAVERGDGLADHESRLRTLERARWPLPSLAGLTGVGALALALLDFTR